MGSSLGPLTISRPPASGCPCFSSALVDGSGLVFEVFPVFLLGFSCVTSRPGSLPEFLPPIPLTARLTRRFGTGAGSWRRFQAQPRAPVASYCADVMRFPGSPLSSGLQSRVFAGPPFCLTAPFLFRGRVTIKLLF
ncbi:hypothetical protein NDU88_005240 [Pleurodeles waltl]|uniref:Uncharacterized protein n=1 Tax=Pleurodeles waltl TaxID=8319 RepID=A0AAV7W7A2_PLEWA|nr:hypothetical protein NDU88_005240 [Pleurodeles waltl]